MQDENNEIVLAKKYRLIQKIGSGSFGSIYLCENMQNKTFYAVKLQKKGKGQGQLQYQIKLYQIFQGIPGISRLYDYGFESQRLFMVIELLSRSLEDLFQLCGKKFSQSTAYNIGIQIITRLQQIHRKGFVHRDIKANNFMVGKRQNCNTVFIIDFGLAKKYKDIKSGKHIQMKSGKSLVGTARYASIASHQGFQQCRRDDLQSLGYLMLYFLRGRLPWQGIQNPNKVQKYKQIGRMKSQANINELCQQFSTKPCALAKYFEAVKKIQFTEQPNYDYLRKILKEYMIKNKCQKAPLDWQSNSEIEIQKKQYQRSKQKQKYKPKQKQKQKRRSKY